MFSVPACRLNRDGSNCFGNGSKNFWSIVSLTSPGRFNIESHTLRHFVQDRLDTPFLQIETDYSEPHTEQIDVRIEAFLEILPRPR